jgi:hypothetical protein
MLRIPPTHISQYKITHGGEFLKFIKKTKPELLTQCVDIYVLRTKSVDGWRPLMNDSQYDTLMSEGTYVVAYACVRRATYDLGILEWLETRIAGYGFGTYLRRRLRVVFGDVLPGQITDDTAAYWKKELGFDDVDVDACEHMHLICGKDAGYFNWESLV